MFYLGYWKKAGDVTDLCAVPAWKAPNCRGVGEGAPYILGGCCPTGEAATGDIGDGEEDEDEEEEEEEEEGVELRVSLASSSFLSRKVLAFALNLRMNCSWREEMGLSVSLITSFSSSCVRSWFINFR